MTAETGKLYCEKLTAKTCYDRSGAAPGGGTNAAGWQNPREAAGSPACNSDETPCRYDAAAAAAPPPCVPIMDLLKEKNNTLYAAIMAADLGQTLTDADAVTIFGPVNEVFSAYGKTATEPGQNLVPKLIAPANKETLKKILLGHVVAGKNPSKDLANQQTLTSLAGSRLIVDLPKVVMADQMACNAILHDVSNIYGTEFFADLVDP